MLVVADPKYRNRVLTIVAPDGARIPTPMCQIVYRFVRRPGPSAWPSMVSGAELGSLAQTLDDLAATKNRARI